VRDVFKRGLRLGDAKAAAIRLRDGIGDEALDQGRVDLASGHVIEAAINEAGGDGAGREDARAHEVPAIEIDAGIGDFAGGNIVGRFQWINHELNAVDRVTEIREDATRHSRHDPFLREGAKIFNHGCTLIDTDFFSRNSRARRGLEPVTGLIACR